MTVTTTSIALRSSPLSRPVVRMLLFVVIALVVMLYIEWKTSRAAPGAASEADTMCIAARIGLSCR